MMATKKPYPELRTEAAIRKAVRLYAYDDADIVERFGYIPTSEGLIGEGYAANDYEILIVDIETLTLLAICDLRDLYRKRQPLTGINKTMRKAIQPKRKKGE